MNVRRPTQTDAAAVAELIGALDTRFLSAPELTTEDLIDEWRELELAEAPAEPAWPLGFQAAGVDYPREARVFHQAIEDSFAEERSHVPQTFAEWHRRRAGGQAFDPRLWLTVKQGNELVAVARCDRERFGMGWIGALGVRKPWRRQGLGLALLRYAFAELYSRGQRVIGLGVDAQNPTGATRLYERAGMSVAWSATVFEKELAL